MGRKSREKRERRKGNSKSSKGPQYFHVETPHPGATTAFRTPPKEVQQALRGEMIASMPAMRDEINAKTARLLEILRSHDPLRLLFAVALTNSIFDPEKYLARESEASPVRTEFALSLATSMTHPTGKPEPSDEVTEEFTSLIEEVLVTTNAYFMADTMAPKYTPAQSEVRMQMLTETLNIRGESHPSHALELVRDLFAPHDAFLQQRFGFVTDAFIRCAKSIEQRILGGFQGYVAFTKRIREVIAESEKTM